MRISANTQVATIYGVAWTADGKTLISATEVTIRTWNATTWQKIVTLRSRHASVIKGIVISPNGRILASAAYDHTAILWNLENGQAIVILHHRDPVFCTSFSPDGKLLATGCRDNKAYIWDISAFIKDAGLGDLPSNPNVDTTRRLGDWRRNPYRPPASFADDSHHLSGSPNLLPPPTHRQHVSASPSSQQHPPTSRISPSRRNDHSTDDTPAQLRFLEWARNPFLNMRNRQNDETELQEHRPAVVDVPLAQARPRNYSAREVRRKQKQEQEQASNAREAEKQKARDAKNAKNTKSTSLGSSRPSKSNVTQQPGGATQTQPTSKLHSAGVSTSSITSVIAAASAGTPHWTRLWSTACCASAQNADGHH